MASIKSYSSSKPNLVGTTSGGQAPQQGQRRRHNFGDRVYKLAPEETPFFAYLSAVAKAPTDDPVFRVLEDRAPTKWADRQFQLTLEAGEEVYMYKAGNTAWTLGSGSDTTIPVSDSYAKELIEGMLVQYVGWDGEVPRQVTGRISNVTFSTGASTVTINTVSNNHSADLVHAYNSKGEMNLQVIGTAFGEGTGAPDSFGYDMDDSFGYTQIFKTAAHMSNTARATVLRGYASEWDRIWSMKLREHKVDIERAFLFNNKGRENEVQYTDGIIGNIIQSGATWESDDADALVYSSGKPFIRVCEANGTEAVYDRFLVDFEQIFAPERGGSSNKFCMASMAVVTYLNRLKGGFMEGSVSSNSHYNLDFAQVEGGLGHKVMKIDTVHGSISVVKNPLLKGIGKSMMVGVDLNNVKYRPLVGNGLNRDTYIDTNVQAPDKDARQDQILTEAGLEVCLPESHFLYQFTNEAGDAPIG